MQLRRVGTWGGESMRHGAEVNSLAFARDADLLVSADGGQPGNVVVWDLAVGRARTTGKAKTYGFTSAAITPDGARFAASGYDNHALVFDGVTGKRRHSFETRAAAHALAFSPDGQWVLAGDDRIPRLFSLGSAADRALKGHSSALKAVAFSPDGRHAATAGGDRKIKLHDVAKGKVIATLPGYASVVAFLSDDRLLYAGFDCGAIVDVPSGKELRSLDLGYLDAAAVSGDGRRLAVKSGREDAAVKVLDLDTGATVFERTFEPLHVLALDHRGKRLAFARAAALAQGTSLEVWSLTTGERLLPMGEGHGGGVTALGIHGRVVVSASTDRTLKLWDVDAGKEIETVDGATEDIGSMALSPDGRTALTTRGYGRESLVQRWDLVGLRVAGEIDCGDLGSARSLAISPDGRTAAASFVRRAALFDLATGKRRVVLEKHKAQIDAVAFSADGRFVVTGAADQLVKVWRVEDGQAVHALTGHGSFVHALVCLPDGTCVSGSTELVRWDLTTGKRLATGKRTEVSRLAASPDGALLLVLGPFDRTVQLWSLAGSGLEELGEETLEDEPSSVAFVGATIALVGTKGGRIHRYAIE